MKLEVTSKVPRKHLWKVAQRERIAKEKAH